MAKVISVSNQKGGVGKTVTSLHLFHAALARQKTVLLVDFDTQGNASQFASGNMAITKNRGGAEQIFTHETWSYTDMFDGAAKLLHGHRYLEDLDRKETLQNAIRLRSKIRGLPFDFVIFDTPPSIGPRQVAPLFWADLLLLVVEPNLASITGLDSMFDTLRGVAHVNPALSLRIAINRFTKRSASQQKVVADLRQKFGSQIIGELAYRTPIADSLARFQPVWTYTRDRALAAAWRDFSDCVLNTVA